MFEEIEDNEVDIYPCSDFSRSPIIRNVMQSRGRDGRLPVFVFPQDLTFYTGDQQSLSQILTLYNPFNFYINFTVLCNNKPCYTVEPCLGSLRPSAIQNLTVTRTTLEPPPYPNHDRIRIIIKDEGAKTTGGRRDVTATLVDGVPETQMSSGDSDKFESARTPRSGTPQGQPQTLPLTTYQDRHPSLLLVGGAVVCIAGLLLPTMGEGVESALPPWLHLPASIKMAIAYALGLLTYAIMRPL